MRVLILGLGENGLGVLRALHTYSDLDLFVVRFSSRDPGKLTRLAPIQVWPDSAKDPEGLVARLVGWSKVHGPTVLFPTRDIEVNLLARFSNFLPKSLIFHRNSLDKVTFLTDKRFAPKIASEAGLVVPKTVIYTDETHLSSLDFNYPLIIKPCSPEVNRFQYKNLFVSNETDLKKLLMQDEILNGRWVIQEYIPGGDDQVYQCNALFGPGARVIAAVEFHKIRQYLPGRGVTSYGHTTESSELSPLCQKLAKLIDYQGLMSVEFKKDFRNGSWTFIESNLRLPIYNTVFPASGINLAYLYISNLLGTNGFEIPRPRVAFYINEDSDLANILTHRCKLSLLSWLIQASKVDAFTFWRLKDPLPGLQCFGRIVYRIIYKVAKWIFSNQ